MRNLLHFSFVVIIVGALLTHFLQIKGEMHLRQGEAASYFVDEEGMVHHLPHQICLDTFYIIYKEAIATDYISEVMIAGARETISMNNILCRDYVRYYQKDYDRDLHGTTLIVNIDPWGIAVTYSGYLLLALSFMGILMRRCNRRIFLIATLLGTIIAVVFLHKDYGIPVLNTWLMPIHVSLIITAYSLFPFAIWRREILHTALAFLAMGICLGAYWAGISWGTYWSWDPKETCALITLLVYAIPLHSASLPLFRSQRFYRLYMTLALLSILMTYFGANLFFGGLHSYR